MSPPEYFFANKLRHVRPYFHTYETHVKTRFLDRTLFEVYTEDLHYSVNGTESQIRNGNLFLLTNIGKKGTPQKISDWDTLSTWKLGRHDLICSLNHIHEPSVTEGCRNYIVYEDDDLLVVNKPSGVPTHPSGSYRYNSMTEILVNELKLKVFPCHRLDKATLGILILAKNKAAASKFLKVNSYKKEYIARVTGKFPAGEDDNKASLFRVNSPIFTLNAAGGYFVQANIENLPLRSITEFKRISYNLELNESIVSCRPITGRMHQIRIHLRNMGFPIVNDGFYNYLQNTSRANILCNEIELELYRRVKEAHPHINTFQPIDVEEENVENNFTTTIDVLSTTNFNSDGKLQKLVGELKQMKKSEINKLKVKQNKVRCEECNELHTEIEKSPEELQIWLHSLKYEMQGYDAFQTAYPDWYYI